MSRQFPSHSRMGIPLHSWNVLVLLELLHGTISCIKIYRFWGDTTHSHNISIPQIISLWYFTLLMLPFIFLWREMHLLLIVSQTCTLTGNFAVAWMQIAWYSLFCLRQTRQWRRMTWLWNTDKFEWVLLPQKGYRLMHDLAPFYKSKRTRTFIESNKLQVLK